MPRNVAASRLRDLSRQSSANPLSSLFSSPKPTTPSPLKSHDPITSRRATTTTTKPAQQPNKHDIDSLHHYLRQQNDLELAKTRHQLTHIIDHLQKQIRILSSFPQTIQLNPSIPPYTLGARLRGPLHDAQASSKKIIEQARYIQSHLTDLQLEPSRWETEAQSATERTLREFARMTTEAKKQLLFDLRMEEDAEKSRLHLRTQSLVDFVGHLRDVSDDNKMKRNDHRFGVRHIGKKIRRVGR